VHFIAKNYTCDQKLGPEGLIDPLDEDVIVKHTGGGENFIS